MKGEVVTIGLHSPVSRQGDRVFEFSAKIDFIVYLGKELSSIHNRGGGKSTAVNITFPENSLPAAV